LHLSILSARGTPALEAAPERRFWPHQRQAGDSGLSRGKPKPDGYGYAPKALGRRAAIALLSDGKAAARRVSASFYGSWMAAALSGTA
jgi:hypothetical protein